MIIGGMTSTALTQPLAAGALRLSDWGLIRARGADAAKFLHGQLTQDIEHLTRSEARLAGYCSAKGRLLASFVVWRTSDEDILLACSADLLAPTLKRLSMFVLRAQCKLSDASAELSIHGLVNAGAWLGDAAPAAPWGMAAKGDATVIRLPDADGTLRHLLVQPSTAEAPALPPVSDSDWARLEARSGVARITAATVEQFVPQMVNLELVGGVNFKKGCYPGQEVVARSQYRGTLKRRAMLFTGADARPGQEVFHSADPGQPAGRVANAGGNAALVEVKLAALDGGSLHLGAADGPVLAPQGLPYALPAETA
ncbi:folate-binding protein YgfZ [Burkholderiales bacterium JOSHI_001]|nr:folate-binding protein YgfZ [Burkholderiales bacterium JOSHI_001]